MMLSLRKRYTPRDSAIVFIDFQPQMILGVNNCDRADLLNNVALLAEVATEFEVPVVVTSVETEGFSGCVVPQLRDLLPGQPIVARTSMNAWDSREFREAIAATGRENILVTGLWTEVCVIWPALSMLETGYNVYLIEDCCGATSAAAQDAALSRMTQAGAVRLTAIAALLEWQRDLRSAVRVGRRRALPSSPQGTIPGTVSETVVGDLLLRSVPVLGHSNVRPVWRLENASASRSNQDAATEDGHCD